MISVSGTFSVKRVPWPFDVSMSISPLSDQVGADDVESNAAAGEFCLAGRGGETGVEQEFEQVAVG